ncbi:hypothetical protein BBJ28_00009277 [Nothophytophthora sp. Chile5]|nr:hypothetical protein BBJ28_00009277 [Nothophytophthora sp. Chile5]
MTKGIAGQQSDLRSHEFPEEGVDIKFLLNPQSGTQSRWASCCLKARCHLKAFFARVAALLAFHVLNVLLAISGAGLVLTFTVLSIVLLPVLLMVLASLVFVGVTIERFPNRNWAVFVLVFVVISAAIIVLLGFVVFWCVLVVGPNVAVWGTLAQHIVVNLNAIAVNGFAFLDVKLASFVVPWMPWQTYSAVRKDEAKLPKIPYDFCGDIMWWQEKLFQYVFATPAMWAAAFYFIVPKLLMGVLSAISVWLSVVQPMVVLASSGQFPCVGTGLTFQDNSSVYAILMAMCWVVGVFGLIFVPVWSVRLTT